ncbi:MAG: dihydropteroate synthase [Planctomycetota bacterium]
MAAVPVPPPLVCGSRTFVFGERACVMGILNVTPDSFSDGGSSADPGAAVERAFQMAGEGADLVDVGGESTRPGAEPVPAEEELRRVIPVLKRLAGRLTVPVSIDTSKPAVAEAALAEGAALVNDISALGDPVMAALVARAGVPVVLMHMQGNPRTMQANPVYTDVVGEVAAWLAARARAAEAAGVAPGRIILDPGIGFGKAPGHNLALLARLDALLTLGMPVLVGPSRKSFIGKITGRDVVGRLAGTAAAVAACALAGVHFVRVHDVREMVDVVRVAGAIRRMGISPV